MAPLPVSCHPFVPPSHYHLLLETAAALENILVSGVHHKTAVAEELASHSTELGPGLQVAHHNPAGKATLAVGTEEERVAFA